ncbi:testis-expressed protein 48 [Sorex fumeus]|uniref:testis-expressed protein 48 n=1 Tax=Sorex fumeus TaxID=62283 RepID=UPI0024AC85C9|nr:testis-expressed protein 48 [Sorex fumeus]
MAFIPFPPTAHKNLFSKIFCICCKACEEPRATDDSSKTQEHQPPITRSWSQIKLDKNTTKPTKWPSSARLLTHSNRKDDYAIDSNFIDDISHVSPRGFYKRNLNRYSQRHWPYQPCLIGQP